MVAQSQELRIKELPKTADLTGEELRTRVDIVEREVEGEKMVTRHILEQTCRNGDDLAAIKSRLDRVESKVDGLSQDVRDLRQDFHDLRGDVTGLRGTVLGLASNLPRIVGDAVRSAHRGRDDER